MSSLKEFKQEVNAVSEEIFDLEARQNIFETIKEDLEAELIKIGNQLKTLIEADIVNTLNDISVSLSSDNLTQVTTFPFEMSEEQRTNFAELLNTDKENIEGNVDVYSNIGDKSLPMGKIIDIIAKIENTLTQHTYEVPLDEKQKQEVLDGIDSKLRKDTKEMIGKEIGLEEALSNESYLCLSVDELTLMSKMSKLEKEIERYDTELIPETARKIENLRNELSFAAQIFTDSEHDDLDNKIKKGTSQALNQAFNHVANGLGDIAEGIKQIALTEVPNPFKDIKLNALNKGFNALKEKTGMFLAKTASIFSKIQPDAIIDSIGEFASKSPITNKIALGLSHTITKITNVIDIAKGLDKNFAYKLSLKVQDANEVIATGKAYEKATDYRNSLRKDIQDDEHKLDKYFEKKNEIQNKIDGLHDKIAELKDADTILRAEEKNASGRDKVIISSEIKDNASELLKLNKQLAKAEKSLAKNNAKIDRTIISLSNHEYSLEFAKEQQEKTKNTQAEKRAKLKSDKTSEHEDR